MQVTVFIDPDDVYDLVQMTSNRYGIPITVSYEPQGNFVIFEGEREAVSMVQCMAAHIESTVKRLTVKWNAHAKNVLQENRRT